MPKDTQHIYDSNAGKWLRDNPSSLSDFTARPMVFDACGDVRGLSVLDIGCGEGYCARELKRRGAGDTVGIDLSGAMIAAAKARDELDGHGIEFLSGDVTSYEPDREFDLCIAVFLFNYLETGAMQQVLSMVHRCLKPGGKFIFSVPHPFFPFVRQTTEPPFYFESGKANYFEDVDLPMQGRIWKRDGEKLHVQCVHKTFTDYFSALKKAGFTALPELKELTVTPDIAAQDPAFFGPLLHQPLHVLFSLQR